MPPPNILDDMQFEELPEWADDAEIVAKFYSSIEAELAAARLRSEGIYCFIANSVSQSVVPHLQGIVRLHTRAEDAALAREILQEAAMDTAMPTEHQWGREFWIIISVLIGLVLAWLLVQRK